MEAIVKIAKRNMSIAVAKETLPAALVMMVLFAMSGSFYRSEMIELLPGTLILCFAVVKIVKLPSSIRFHRMVRSAQKEAAQDEPVYQLGKMLYCTSKLLCSTDPRDRFMIRRESIADYQCDCAHGGFFRLLLTSDTGRRFLVTERLENNADMPKNVNAWLEGRADIYQAQAKVLVIAEEESGFCPNPKKLTLIFSVMAVVLFFFAAWMDML